MLRTMILAALLSSAACVATGTVSGGGGYYAQPDLVEIEPGVQVIVDYDEPIFYSDNYYWRNNGGVWYRSSYYNRGWVSAQPPTYVARIESPGRYRHYRPAGYQPGVRDHRRNDGYNNNNNNRPAVRDHRNDNYNPPPQGPTVRDHRSDSPPPQGPTVRDHRSDSPPPPPPQGPTVREHGGGDRSPPPPPPPRREEPKGPTVREHR